MTTHRSGDDENRLGLATAIARGIRLRCPRCGIGRLFRGLFSMEPGCSNCGLAFQREPGYFLGSIYINYGLTAALVVVGYFSLYFSEVVTPQTALWILAAFSVLFPMWFFRYARSIWLAFDQYFDPVNDGEHRAAP
jgi:uncharacterized protein (DUF983 family)